MKRISTADVDPAHQFAYVARVHPTHDQLIFTVPDVGDDTVIGRRQPSDGQFGQGDRLAFDLLTDTQVMQIVGERIDRQQQVIGKIVGIHRMIGKHLFAQTTRGVVVQVFDKQPVVTRLEHRLQHSKVDQALGKGCSYLLLSHRELAREAQGWHCPGLGGKRCKNRAGSLAWA